MSEKFMVSINCRGEIEVLVSKDLFLIFEKKAKLKGVSVESFLSTQLLQVGSDVGDVS